MSHSIPIAADNCTLTNESMASLRVAPMAEMCPPPPATATSTITHSISECPNSSRSNMVDSGSSINRVPPGMVPETETIPPMTPREVWSSVVVNENEPAIPEKVPLPQVIDVKNTIHSAGVNNDRRGDKGKHHRDIVQEMRHGAPIAHVNTKHSHHSSISSASSLSGDTCRICHCEATPTDPLITPCYCNGSLRYVHQKCLQQWIRSSQTTGCEVCRYTFKMHSRLKPILKWEKLDLSAAERRKVLCSIAFHLVAITCVSWSLYVLIDRTFSEAVSSNFYWPFWTKLAVVVVGLAGGAVFMYVQCKMYAHLCKRWHAYNRVIYVQNCPEVAQVKAKIKKERPSMSHPQSHAASIVIGVDRSMGVSSGTVPTHGPMQHKQAVTLRHAQRQDVTGNICTINEETSSIAQDSKVGNEDHQNQATGSNDS